MLEQTLYTCDLDNICFGSLADIAVAFSPKATMQKPDI
jgi:hypothetical protein